MPTKPAHQPGYKRCRSGIFKPLHPEKYAGNPSNIVFRSGLEKRFFKLFDENPNVLQWGSEEMHVKYMSKADKRVRRYFPDLVVKLKQRNGTVRVMMLEIKPKSQCSPPKKRKNTKRYLEELKTWQVNQDKWEAAKKFCDDHNMTFWVVTEEHLERI